MLGYQHTPDGFYVRAAEFAAGFVLGVTFFFLLLGSYQMPAVAYAEVVRAQLAQEEITYLDSVRTLIERRAEERREREEAYKKEVQELYSTIGSRSADGYIAATTTGTHKAIVADLDDMRLYVYQESEEVASLPILSKGRPGTRWETPAGLYTISTKEETHFSTIGEVYMPYSMQFFGNFFIHGWPYYSNGDEVPPGFSGGCIRLSTEDARSVFNFVDIDTPIIVKRNNSHTEQPSVTISNVLPPKVSAASYIVANIDSGDVYVEKNASRVRPIASISKLITALVANETISYDKMIHINPGAPIGPNDFKNINRGETFRADDLVYPLLMESNNAVAHALADYYGPNAFVRKMNEKAKALGMYSTSFSDPSGISAQNTSSADDLFKLAQYLEENSLFTLNITKNHALQLKSEEGTEYTFANHNLFSDDPRFMGGKTGYTTAAKQTMLTVFKVPVDEKEVRIAIIVLASDDRKADVEALLGWFTKAAKVPVLETAE